ncbi:MAG: hypothetical protein A2234_04265 [Elusimicrobia bacterium RIFOXYA2_FULL_58_8]|nr:MAG: hypothetical protein A2285_01080 [Elusimicrobia bacterium RIFOXYA12_FULL_57_11]OGS16335.1 MAG: hypothetical protein A2234_04265 [Elusimicrobia bacterium RIFOXYA2_FULL_58_8]
MLNKLSRSFILIFSITVLPPVFGAAVSFGEFYSGADIYADAKAGAAGHYLAIPALDLGAVPAAPAPGSAKDLADFEALFAWQAGRTQDDCTRARAEMEHSYEVFFGKITPFISPQPAAVREFFGNVGEDSVAAHRYMKDIYKRPRPFLRDERLKPCIARVSGYAYPSGHATMSRLFALILGDLVPSRRREFLARADEAALNRVIGGVHHPTDIEAGRILANELYRNLSKAPEFAADMNGLRRYLR